MSVQCLGLGEQAHWVAAVVGGDGVGDVGVQRAVVVAGRWCARSAGARRVVRRRRTGCRARVCRRSRRCAARVRRDCWSAAHRDGGDDSDSAPSAACRSCLRLRERGLAAASRAQLALRHGRPQLARVRPFVSCHHHIACPPRAAVRAPHGPPTTPRRRTAHHEIGP